MALVLALALAQRTAASTGGEEGVVEHPTSLPAPPFMDGFLLQGGGGGYGGTDGMGGYTGAQRVAGGDMPHRRTR